MLPVCFSFFYYLPFLLEPVPDTHGICRFASAGTDFCPVFIFPTTNFLTVEVLSCCGSSLFCASALALRCGFIGNSIFLSG